MASTLPGEPPPASHAWLSDVPAWCVDLGPRLQAMTTCDLWLGLAKGEIRPEMKVWREGMACWEPVRHVPEFALAMPDATVWPVAPGGVPARRTAASEAAAITAARAAEPPPASTAEPPPASTAADHGMEAAAVGVVTLAPPSDFSTPAPVVVDHGEVPPASGARRRLSPRIDRRGAVSVVAGALIAITSLALATTGPAPGSESRPASAGARPAAPMIEYELSTQAPAGLPAAPEPARTVEMIEKKEAVTAAAPAVAPAKLVPAKAGSTRPRAPRGPHAADRGQRRIRGAAR